MRHFSLYETGMDEARAWIDDDDSAVMVKIISGTDPVELNPDEARLLGNALLDLAAELDRLDGTP